MALPGARPNLLLITADDMNWDLSGFMGNQAGLTPRLDVLAARSHIFVNNRTVVPICQPSRAAMLTGLLPHRSGGTGFTPLHRGTKTLASILHANGYLTAATHKLEHMQPESCFPWDISRDGKDRNPLIYAEDADRVIAAARQVDKPFFLCCNIPDPHRPFYGSPPSLARDGGLTGPYRVEREIGPQDVSIPAVLEDRKGIREELARYWNSVQRLDITIGKILDRLAAADMTERTVVVFTSDHGMPLPFAKGTCFNDGTRAPVVINWPAMGEPQRIDALTTSMDLLPTLLAILGVPAPAALDGMSWLDLIDDVPVDWRKHVFTFVNTVASGTAFTERAVHDSRYLLIFAPWSDGALERDLESSAGLTFNTLVNAARDDPAIAERVRQNRFGDTLALFDLEQDPGQRQNLASDVAHGSIRDRMLQVLLTEMRRSDDPELCHLETFLAGGRPVVLQDRARFRSLKIAAGARAKVRKRGSQSL